MPTFDFSFKDFCKLVGKKLPTKHEDLWDKLLFVKCEVEDFEKDNLKVEAADTNRPDMWCVEGLARSLKGALGIKTGLEKYVAKKSNHLIKVDKSISKIRPFIAAAVVKGVEFNDTIIKQLIQLQLKLDTTYGRKRKKSAIGVYDYDKIVFPITYKAVKPNSNSFIPLGFQKIMTPEEIIEEHPKGVEFGNIVKDFKKYPMLLDSKKNVLSMPPIINSNDLGKVTTETKNVFIEVTGTNLSTVMGALNIMASTLADRGGKVESVLVNYGKKKITSPNFNFKTMSIKLSKIKERLGLILKPSEIKSLLERARFGVKKINNELVIVEIPFYRTDIMHEFDVIEDIGIMYGYNNIKSEEVKISTNGELLPITNYLRIIRKLVVGMGYQEILNYYRVDKEILFDKDCVEIANPIGITMNVLRNELTPVSINFLSKNTHNELPQKVFEVGKVFLKSKDKIIEENHLSIVSTHSTADFTEIKQVSEWILNSLGKKFTINEFKHDAFIKGRCASIKIKDKIVGYFGEIHPKTLNGFGLENPTIALELNLKKIKK